MPDSRPDEFYVGWAPRAPERLARQTRVVVAALLAAVAGVALALVAGQRALDGRVFEFGILREFAGTIELDPAPLLVVTRPGGGTSRYLLVGAGKHGARELVAEFTGERVRLRATLISRGAETALEVEAGSVVREGRAAAPESAQELGTRVLRGEIVDSKCHYGVMNPGEGKAHRDCAVRCISGGAPPVLRVYAPEGEARYFLLTGADGRNAAPWILDYVAEPVEVTGRAERHGGVYVLRIGPDAVRRLEGDEE